MEQNSFTYFECGKGWHSIIQKAVKRIEAEWTALTEKHREEGTLNAFYEWYGEGTPIVQIKEKFGTLRIYVKAYTEGIDAAIKEAERDCEITCEHCGSKQDVELRTDGWYSTMCDACHSSKR